MVLYFYPKSFTSVCTVEAHEFAENIENFAAAGASVIGLSGDKIEVQRDFSTKECRRVHPSDWWQTCSSRRSVSKGSHPLRMMLSGTESRPPPFRSTLSR